MTLDIAQLASGIAAVIAPLLPSIWEVGKGFVTKMGEGAAEEAGKKVAESTFEKGKEIINRLQPKVSSDLAIREALETVSTSPNDEHKQKALQQELFRVLTSDMELAQALHSILTMSASSQPSMTFNQSGEKSVINIGNIETLNMN